MIIDKQFACSIEQCFLKSHKAVVTAQRNSGLDSNSFLVGSGEAFYLGKFSFLTQVNCTYTRLKFSKKLEN